MQIHIFYSFFKKIPSIYKKNSFTFCVDCSDVSVSVPRTPRHVVEDSTKKEWSKGIKTKSAGIRQYYRVYTICRTWPCPSMTTLRWAWLTTDCSTTTWPATCASEESASTTRLPLGALTGLMVILWPYRYHAIRITVKLSPSDFPAFGCCWAKLMTYVSCEFA